MKARSYSAVVLFALLVAPLAAWGSAKTCLTGTDPSIGGDASQIAALRSQIDTACPCATFDGSPGKTHGSYVTCAGNVLKAQVSAGQLRTQCKATVKTYYANSTCGLAASTAAAPCIKTSTKTGKITCAIKTAVKCVSQSGKFTQLGCPGVTTCIDAADTNHDGAVGAGDSGACAPPAPPSVSWTNIGPEGGRVDHTAVDPNDAQHLLAGASTGGIFESHDGGAHWEYASTGLTDLQISSIAFASGGTPYALTVESGLYRRLKTGAWSLVTNQLASGAGIHYPLLFAADGSGHGLVVTYTNTGVTSDNGATWTVLPHPAGSSFLSDATFVGSPAGLTYLATSTAIYKSSNYGGTWNPLPSPPGTIDGVLGVGSTGSTLYVWARPAGAAGLNNPHLFKSIDGGTSWSTLPAMGRYDILHTIVVNPTSDADVYVGGSFGIYHSLDGGTTWTEIQQEFGCPIGSNHRDTFCGVDIVSMTADWAHDTLFVSHDQGVYSFGFQTHTFTELTGNLNNVQAYAMSVGSTGKIYLGSQDTGTFIYSQGSWQNEYFGDTGDVIEAKDGSGTWFRHAIVGTSICRISANGSSVCFDQLNFNLTYPRTGSMVYGMTTLYLASDGGIEKTDDEGRTFVQASSKATQVLSFDATTNRLYAAKNTELFQVTPSEHTLHVFNANITSVVARGSTIIVATGLSPLTGQQQNGGVFVTHDGGDQWTQTDLPTDGAYVVAANPRCAQQYLVGYQGQYAYKGSHGVFLSTDDGDTWGSIGTAIAINPITGIGFPPAPEDVVYVSTYGRAVFQGQSDVFMTCGLSP